MNRSLTLTMLTFALLAGLALRGVEITRADEKVEKKAEEKTKSVRGTLQAVDNDRVKVKVDGGSDLVTARVGGETKISVEGKEGALTDLKAGQDVTCVYVTREGMNVCLSLMARAKKGVFPGPFGTPRA